MTAALFPTYVYHSKVSCVQSWLLCVELQLNWPCCAEHHYPYIYSTNEPALLIHTCVCIIAKCLINQAPGSCTYVRTQLFHASTPPLSPSTPCRYITISCLTNMVFGTFTLFLANSCILHQYMNLMAELTRFADRHFYEVRLSHTAKTSTVKLSPCVW